MTYLSLTIKIDYIDKNISNLSGSPFLKVEVPGPSGRVFPSFVKPIPDMSLSMNEHQILEAMKIQPTYARKAVLQIVMGKSIEEFTIDDICREKDSRKLHFTKTSVAQALRLFQVRGLIVQSGEKKCPQRGRPTLLFKVASKFP
jgi:predicted transcriptional regulator